MTARPADQAVTTCPTCKRRPSERYGECYSCKGDPVIDTIEVRDPLRREDGDTHDFVMCETCKEIPSMASCPDPIHDRADALTGSAPVCECPDHPRHLLARVNGVATLLPYHVVTDAAKASGEKWITGTITPAPPSAERILTQATDEATLRPLDEWHEEDGPVLWWHLPVCEPPWVGTPLDSDWLVHEVGDAPPIDIPWRTHWCPLPQIVNPAPSTASASESEER